MNAPSSGRPCRFALITLLICLAFDSRASAQTRDGSSPKKRQEATPNLSKAEKALFQAASFELRLQGASLRELLERLHKATGNSVRCVDSLGRELDGALRQRFDLELAKATFWEAIAIVAERARLRIKSAEGGLLVLSDAVPELEARRPAGKAARAGPLELVPEIDGFFRRATIRIHSEPRLRGLRCVSWRASATLPGGKVVEVAPEAPLEGVSINLKGETEIALDQKALGGAAKIPTLRLRTRWSLPQGIQPERTPPLVDLLSGQAEQGGVRLSLLRFESRRRGREEMLELEIGCEGAAIEAADLRVVDAGGKSHSAVTSSRRAGRLELVFRAGPVEGGLAAAKLSVEVPVLERYDLGELDSLVGKETEVGLTKLQVLKIERLAKEGVLQIRIQSSGAALDPRELRLARGGGEPVVAPEGHEANTAEGRQSASVRFPLEPLGPQLEGWRLVARAAKAKRTLAIARASRLAAKPFRSGIVELQLLAAGPSPSRPDEVRLALKLRGMSPGLEEMRLIGAGGVAIPPVAWAHSRLADGDEVELRFRAEDLDGPLPQHRLALPVAARAIEQWVDATLVDLELSP